ncbi:MAG: hypothetical protein OHK0029_42760 [Armatimonadaceae bacterium]
MAEETTSTEQNTDETNQDGREGGFSANPELAREAGRKGGEIVKQRYGSGFYKEIGRKGGEAVKRNRGREFYSEIGRKGGEMRGVRAAEARANEPEPEPKPKRKRGRPRKNPQPTE